MTTTTIPQGLGARSWNTVLKVTASVALMALLIVGSFAVGRGSADDGGSPSVDSNSRDSGSYVVPDPASCNHTANTPPC